MRKKLLLLVLSLAALAGSLLAPRAEADSYHACPICTTYSNGSQCCVSCVCNSKNIPIACTDNYCPPEGGID
jgi:hypothetical protein